MLMTTTEIADITATVPTVASRSPSANMERAYALGQRYAHIHWNDAPDSMSSADEEFFFDVIECWQNVEAAYRAGRAGTPMPTWEAGWRYGDAPMSGQSRNNANGDLEYGISMMAVRGHGETGDLLSATFCANGRPVRYYAGWLVTHTTGSDGEPLFIAPRPIQ